MRVFPFLIPNFKPMDLNLFFDPVEEELFQDIESPYAVSKSITLNSYNISEPDDFDIALIGLTESRGSSISGEIEKATYFIRQKLYPLKKGSGAYNVIDLGNLRNGIGLDDTKQRLEEVCSWLLSKSIVPVIFGGTHDFGLSQYMAYESFNKLVSIVNIDSEIDLSESEDKQPNEKFLFETFTKEPNFLFNYIHLAYQSYLNDQPTIDTLDSLFFDAYRLGQIKDNIRDMEPLIREADMMTWDIAAIQNSYCAGNPKSQVFGLTGEEACQLSWYAGHNSKLSSYGIYEYYPELDDSDFSSASVIATMLWYFIEGYYERKDEKGFSSNNYFRYEVSLEKDPHSIVFYKSKMNEKWWIEVPYPKDYHKFARNAIVPCGYSDYECATKGEVPERWIDMQAKFT